MMRRVVEYKIYVYIDLFVCPTLWFHVHVEEKYVDFRVKGW
jgi:hypothetical protein